VDAAVQQHHVLAHHRSPYPEGCGQLAEPTGLLGIPPQAREAAAWISERPASCRGQVVLRKIGCVGDIALAGQVEAELLGLSR
jgi:hypothetical protein